jgi:hypothetical protein
MTNTAMLVGFVCTACQEPVEAVLASIEARAVGCSQISATSHERVYGHVPQRLRYKITPVGRPEGG